MSRKGMMVGRGSGYKNVIGVDPKVHSQSAQSIKQPQKVYIPQSYLDLYPKKNQNSIFNITDVATKTDYIKKHITAPFVSSHYSTLGGEDKVSILFTVSLDHPFTWHNKILENSRYGHFNLERDGSLEHFSGTFGNGVEQKKSMRKTKVKSVEEAVRKINQYLTKITESENIYTATNGEKMLTNLPRADAEEYASHGWKVTGFK